MSKVISNVRSLGRQPNPVTGKTVFKPGTSNDGCLDAWVISLTLAGHCDYTLENGSGKANKLMLRAKEMLVIRPGVTQHWQVPMHTTGQASGWTVIWTTFNPRPHWLEWLDWPGHPKDEYGYYHLMLSDPTAARHAKSAMERMHQHSVSGRRNCGDLALNALEEALLWCQDEQSRQSNVMDGRVTDALHYLAGNLSKPVTLQELARVCHTSRARLAALFMRQVGVPPMRYFEQQRMTRAAQLLEMTPLQVKQIAQQLGYDDAHHFSKRFQIIFQQTPTRYRQTRQASQAK